MAFTREISPNHWVHHLQGLAKSEIVVELHMSREVADDLMAEANRRLNSDSSKKPMAIDVVTPIQNAINLYRNPEAR